MRMSLPLLSMISYNAWMVGKPEVIARYSLLTPPIADA
jgi:hypothetical protein